MEDTKARGLRIGQGALFENFQIVDADNMPLDPNSPPLVMLNPAGAVDLLMPTSSAALTGRFFVMVNLTANAITLKTDGDAAFTAAIVIASGQMALVVCTGSTTQALGWRAMVAAGTQTSP